MAYNSAYTGSQVDAAVGAVRQKETKWDNKQDELTGTEDQLVGFNSAGEAVAVAKPDPLPAGGETGQVLTKTAEGTEWDDIPSDLPAGGTAGQILEKTETGTQWADKPSGGMTQTEADARYLQLSGGTMTGDLHLTNDKLTVNSVMSFIQLLNTTSGYSFILVGTNQTTIAPSPSAIYRFLTTSLDMGNNPITNCPSIIPPPDRQTATLSASGWSGNAQTITVQGVIADQSAQDIDISCADKASAAAWAAGGVWCSNPTQANKLTFTCTTPPTANINLNIRLWEVGG